MSDARALLKAKRAERAAPTKASSRPAASKAKRKVIEDVTLDVKRRRVEVPEAPEAPEAPLQTLNDGGFPADFFADPSRAPPPPPSDDEDETEDTSFVQPTPSSSTTIDAEFEAFQRAIAAQAIKPHPADTNHESYQRATVFAEPELVTDLPAGFPTSVLNIVSERQKGAQKATEVGNDEPVEEQEDEGARTKRLQQEERELIVDRLLDEEQAQEEADAKVSALKARLELVKRKRAEARAAKQAG